MAWTREQLSEIEAAIMALVTGAQSYSIGGRTVTKVNLADLRTLRAEIRAEIGDLGPRILRGRLENPQ
jgi:hypothetical protein